MPSRGTLKRRREVLKKDVRIFLLRTDKNLGDTTDGSGKEVLGRLVGIARQRIQLCGAHDNSILPRGGFSLSN